jgi:hypothetical protein
LIETYLRLFYEESRGPIGMFVLQEKPIAFRAALGFRKMPRPKERFNGGELSIRRCFRPMAPGDEGEN